jgi:Sulfotransferase family
LGGVVPVTAATDPATLPSFIIIGAMKAGTTSLADYLRDHPDVYLPKMKELNFFVDQVTDPEDIRVHNWHRGVEWYARQFRDGTGTRMRGEASPNYTKMKAVPGTAARMASIIPEARLIYLVRDPVERIASHHRHLVAAGRERRPLGEAVATSPRYLDPSMYAKQVAEYRNYFPSDRILVVVAEHLWARRDETFRSIMEFLGLEFDRQDEDALAHKANVSERKRVPGSVLTRARRLPGWWELTSRLPDQWKAAATRPFTRALPAGAGSMTARVQERLRDELASDVRALWSDLPTGFDGWGFTPPDSSPPTT